MIDAHTHLQKIPKSLFPSLLRRAEEVGVTGAVVCGTSPEDWGDVKHICQSEKFFYAGYGVHPWYAKNLDSDWVGRLREYLQGDIYAHVGEIGLDKHFPNLADLETQKMVMKTQLEIARDFNRPVTLHCVKAQAEILEVMKSSGFFRTGLPVILHSFTGNLEQLEQLMRASENFYFSVNCKFNRDNVLRRIPLHRLLLETDSPDQLAQAPALEPLQQGVNDPAQLRSLLCRVARIRDTSEEALMATVRANTLQAFRLG